MNLKSHIIVRPSNVCEALLAASQRSIIAAKDYKSIPWMAKQVVDRTERGTHTIKEFGITLPKRGDGEGVQAGCHWGGAEHPPLVG